MTDHPPMQDKQILSDTGKQQAAESLRKQIYDYWKRAKSDFGQASWQSFVREAIMLALNLNAARLVSESIPTPTGEERESAQEFATHYVLEKYPKEAIKSRGFAPSLVIELMEAYASRRIAALQQRIEELENRK